MQAEDKETLEEIIRYMESTSEDSWCTEVVRQAEGANCFFGHLSAYDKTENAHGELWEWFEETWGTTFYVFPINDGTNPDYPQATPKQRILAYLNNLLTGVEDDMETYWKKASAYILEMDK